MGELSDLIKSFIKPELMILVPVLYLIGYAIKKSPVPSWTIPFILGLAGVLLSALYVGSTCEMNNLRETLAATFTAVTQGVLVAGCSVYFANLIKQSKEAKNPPSGS